MVFDKLSYSTSAGFPGAFIAGKLTHLPSQVSSPWTLNPSKLGRMDECLAHVSCKRRSYNVIHELHRMYEIAERNPQQDFESGQSGGNDEQNEHTSDDEGDIGFDGTTGILRKPILSSRKH